MSQLCSVVCLAYNHERFVKAALDSIYQQNWPDTEIIVVDDGSTDGTVEVVREAFRDSPFPTTLITQHNTGNVPQNFNRGLGQAAGAGVMFLSLDDMLLPGCIDSRMSLLQSDRQMAFVADVGYREIDERGSVVLEAGVMPIAAYEVQQAADLLEAEYQTIGSLYIQGQVFRRAIIDAIGGFDETMTGDDIVLRTKLFRYLVEHPDLGFQIGQQIVFAYRKHGQNLHKKFLRQFQTVVEWKGRFFPDRPYPGIFFDWLDNFFWAWVAGNASEAELSGTLALDPVIAEHYGAFRSKSKVRRKLFQRRISAVLAGGRSRNVS